jgi:hypothetical protein
MEGKGRAAPKAPNPKRVAAGKRNRSRRGPLTEAGRQRLRDAALAGQPWRQASGPRTPAGKARAAANGRWRQRGQRSVREIRAELAELNTWLRELRALRHRLKGVTPP